MYFMKLGTRFLDPAERGIIFYFCSLIAIVCVLGSDCNSHVKKTKD